MRCSTCNLVSVFVCASANAQDSTSRKTGVHENSKATPQTADGHPDLTGHWMNPSNFVLNKKGNEYFASLGNRGGKYDPKDPDQIQARLKGRDNEQRLSAANQPPYKPELMEKVHHLEENENQLDPAFACHPSGVPRMGPPLQIVQSPGQVVFLYSSENGAPYRIIHTDGRPHRTDVDASYMGDSVAHWEGDTLVIDVVNFNDDTWLGNDGWFHSTKMHVIERLNRTGDVLTYKVTVEDPEVFTKPWEESPRTIRLDTDPADEITEEGPCVEEDRGHMVSHEHL